MSAYNTIPAKHFVQMLSVNVNNKALSDEAFRELVRNTIATVEGGDGKIGHEFRAGTRVYKEVEAATE